MSIIARGLKGERRQGRIVLLKMWCSFSLLVCLPVHLWHQSFWYLISSFFGYQFFTAFVKPWILWIKKNKAKEFEKFSMKYHLQMWQPREFLFRKVFMQYLHTTISALGLLWTKRGWKSTIAAPFQSRHLNNRPVHVPDVPGEGVPRQLLEAVRADFLYAFPLRLSVATIRFFRISSWTKKIWRIYHHTSFESTSLWK